MAFTIKKYLPKSLLGRSLMIIVMPLIMLQLISGTIFFETHWDKVSLRLARGVAGAIAAIINMLRIEMSPKNRARRHADFRNRSRKISAQGSDAGWPQFDGTHADSSDA